MFRYQHRDAKRGREERREARREEKQLRRQGVSPSGDTLAPEVAGAEWPPRLRRPGVVILSAADLLADPDLDAPGGRREAGQ